MIKNKKALVSPKTKGLIKSFEQSEIIKRFPIKNQDVCSFCCGEMIDDSIVFKGISACVICLQKFSILDANLREYQAKRRVKYEGG